jgi:hypothetical protein
LCAEMAATLAVMSCIADPMLTGCHYSAAGAVKNG